MREILFRGKTKYRRDVEWIEGSLVRGVAGYDGSSVMFIYDLETTIDGRGWIGNYYGEAVDPETVGQFTGLLDKNGKKIFEGDIVKASWGYKGVVEYDSFMYAKLECTISDDIEVIGNVHDNPEMLSVVEVMKYQEGK